MIARICNLGLTASCLVIAIGLLHGWIFGSLVALSAAAWFLVLTIREWR